MPIPVSPQEIVNAVVGNNPSAIKENMVSAGLADPFYQVTPQGFMQLLQELPTATRDEAIALIGRLFDIQIDNNGFAAPWLYRQVTDYGMDLGKLSQTIFAAHLPGGSGELPITSGCSCGMRKTAAVLPKHYRATGLILLGLAAFGLFAFLALGIKILQKLFRI